MLRFRQAAALLAAATLLSCGDDDLLSPAQRRDVVITRVQVSPDTATVLAGQTVQLRATVFDQAGAPVHSASVSWLTSDAQLALVDRGVVSALAEGVVAITAVAGAAVGTATLTVADQSVPAVPSSFRASAASDTEVDLSWADNSKNEDEFRIERQTVTAGVAGAEGAASSAWVQVGTSAKNQPNFRDSGLSAGTSYGYRVSACNVNGCSTTTDEAQTATHATLNLETATLPGGNVGTAYSEQLSASGGSGVYRWTATGSLPPGLVLAQSGRLSGRPTQEGDFSFGVQVTSGGQEDTGSLSVSIGPVVPPLITTESLPTGVRGKPYAAYVKASQGDGTYSWVLTDGTLPDGLSFSPLGYLSGIPTEAGEFDLTVEVTSGGTATSGDVTLIVYDPVFIREVSSEDLSADAGETFSLRFLADGGDGAYVWSTSAGALPTGLTLSEQGMLSGTPTDAGTFLLTFNVTTGDGQTATRTVELDVWPNITSASGLPPAIIGTAYSVQLEHVGDGSSFWDLDASSALPAGLKLSPEGILSGTPTTVGTYSFYAWVWVTRGSSSLGVGKLFKLTVSGTSAVIDASLLPSGYLGAEYAFDLTASGGEGAFAWSVSSGSLPPGLALDPDGSLTGTPTQAGMYPFGVTATSGDEVAFEILTITVSTVDPDAFNIRAVSVSSSVPSEAALDGVNRALARWEEIITGDVADASIAAGSLLDCQGFDTFAEGLDLDDLVVLIDLSPIDGPSGILGGATPCSIRDVGFLPTTGILILDSDDLAVSTEQEIQEVAFHEIGHILGIGTLWDVADGVFFPVLSGKSQSGDPDPRYIGAQAVAQYLALGGSDDDIAVENTGGAGTADAHWRETTFGSEIMTGFIGPGAFNPVSVMTIGALTDLGYTTDLGAADAYALPVAAPPLTAAERRQRGYDVIYQGPILVHDREGRRIRVIERN